MDLLTKLNGLLATVLQSNGFYARKLQGIQNKLPLSSLTDFVEQFPFTTKAELVQDQQDHPIYGTNLTFPIENYTRFSQTSGTTGTPLRWLDTPESWDWMLNNWVRVFQTTNVKAGDTVFFAFSFGPFLGFWTAFEAAQKLGCLCIPAGGMNSASRIHAIIDNRVDVLCCTPTYALRLAEVAGEEGIDLGKSGVRAIIAAGEPGASIPATRNRIEELWRGASVFDHHGMTEIGPVSYECSENRGVLHIIEEAFIPEIINPETQNSVEEGEVGELVLTNLGRVGSPLLRYRTGDLVRQGRCGCGVHDLALEGGILGRSDDMVLVKGVNVYPSAIEKVVRDFPDAAEYRVEIRSERAMTEMQIQVEPVVGCQNPAELAREIQKALNIALSLRIPVEPVPSGTLPRFEMKAKRWIIYSDQ